MSDPPPSNSFLPLDALFNNPLFAGGIGLASIGAAAAIGRRAVVRSATLIKRRLLVDVEISKQDNAYPWLLAWLAIPRPPANFFSVNLSRIHHYAVETTSRSVRKGDRAAHAHFMLNAGYGRHIVRHGNAFISVNREKQSTSNMQTGEPHETLTLTTLYAHRNVFEDVFREAQELALSAQEGKTVMYSTRGAGWETFGQPRRKRPLESVILDKGIKDRIVADVKDFLHRQQWYVDRGIPYRRGYLLYGPPGSGKSSFIQALAGELDFGVAIINLSERGITDDKLADLLTKLPARSILLLEDADAAFKNRRQVDADGYGGATVTFSGLLNALDGVAAGEERVAFLTTNHIDRLDEALIRPGRVDMTVRIGAATRHQAAEMWDRFYGDIDENGKRRDEFLGKLEAMGLIENASGEKKGKLHTSTAAIQGLFLFNKHNMDGAISMAESLVPRRYEHELEDAGVAIKMPA